VTNNNSHDGDFWSPKTVEQLAAEQGVAPIADPAQVFGHGRDLWESDEEFEAFVAGIQARDDGHRLYMSTSVEAAGMTAEYGPSPEGARRVHGAERGRPPRGDLR